MSKILNAQKAIRISRQLREKNKRIVLAGGCFDILHMGHVKFLENAKKLGDVLFVLLESDESVKKLKGKNRPINQQKERAGVLRALETVSHVVLLKNMKTDNDYDNLITQIKPHIIATTQNDPYKKHKERQAKLIKAKVAYVIQRIKSKSTTRLAKLIKKDSL
ncbi:adenylyltransferase/cytidyltransferase family protein [Patescibacteria group bacterium]|nr:adenylyltransferase/cytidyltransferase family protein [Patescibacteria group bacterium]